mmetsp:Transcript_8781/g.33135  ORF Transcript_8781/g.33135 Transcript_8781/m.33135 type:complete len:259 (-) Transcript_8781:22-798(-)
MKILEGEGLAGEHGLRDHASESDHGQAAVLQLLELQILLLLVIGLRVVAKEVKLEVSRLAISLSQHHFLHGDCAPHLRHADPQQNLGHAAELHGRVVRGNAAHVVHRAGKVDAKIGGDEANNSQHADAAMLKLGLTHPTDVHGVREAKRVKANISNQGAIQGRWARHEGKRGRLGGKRGGGLRLGLRNLLALCGRGRGLLGCHAQGASSTPHGRGHEGRALAGHQCQSDNCNSTDHDEALGILSRGDDEKCSAAAEAP